MKGNLLLFVSLFAGILVGMTGAMPHWLLNPQLPMLLLELLIVQVGMGIGSMEHLDRLFAGFRWEMLLLPVFTIVGTLLFSATAVLLFSGHSLSDFLAVGSGFGYYSLSSVLISQVKGGIAGSAAANQGRYRRFCCCQPARHNRPAGQYRTRDGVAARLSFRCSQRQWMGSYQRGGHLLHGRMPAFHPEQYG